MAASSAASVSLRSRPLNLRRSLATPNIKSQSVVSFSVVGSKQRFARFRVSCAAKPETVEKVCKIVKKQLALPEGTEVVGESKFSELGADSLDTVEIVMGLEEEFDISVEEDSAQTINTVQDAANLIQKLVEMKETKDAC